MLATAAHDTLSYITDTTTPCDTWRHMSPFVTFPQKISEERIIITFAEAVETFQVRIDVPLYIPVSSLPRGGQREERGRCMYLGHFT